MEIQVNEYLSYYFAVKLTDFFRSPLGQITKYMTTLANVESETTKCLHPAHGYVEFWKVTSVPWHPQLHTGSRCPRKHGNHDLPYVWTVSPHPEPSRVVLANNANKSLIRVNSKELLELK